MTPLVAAACSSTQLHTQISQTHCSAYCQVWGQQARASCGNARARLAVGRRDGHIAGHRRVNDLAHNRFAREAHHEAVLGRVVPASEQNCL